MRTTNGSVARVFLTAMGLFSAMAIIGAGLFAGVGAASTALCTGDTVLEFEGVRLLNADGQRSAGPFALQLDPGIYRVEAASHDGHGADQVTQPKEQWSIHSDGGWVSPFTEDIADDVEISFSAFGEQRLEGPVSSITLQHRGEGGVNSVDPVCVGFTFVAPLDQPGAEAGDGTEEPGGADGGDAAGGDDGGDAGEPGDAAGGDADNVDCDGGAIGDFVDDVTGNDDPDDCDADGGDAADGGDEAAGGDDVVDPEVAGRVENASSLARTGSTPLTNRIFGAALMLLGLGGLLILGASRSQYGPF